MFHSLIWGVKCPVTGILFAAALMSGWRPRAGEAAEHEPWAGAAARIEQHRKADTFVRVVDSRGRPVVGATVRIEQTRHAFLFGCNIFLWGRVGDTVDETAYRKQFAELLNYATLPFYWSGYEPRPGQPVHERTEKVARWCQLQGITTKGHPLAWNHSDPSWLPDDLDRVRALQLERIEDCVRRFRGLIDIWDVVNEATHFERAQFRRRAPKLTGMWEKAGRIAFVQDCFRRAAEANPHATLLINDYRTDAAYVALLDKLAKDGSAPHFTTIGIQSHMHGGVWSNEKLWKTCQTFATFGVPLHFTELTVVSGATGRGRASRGNPWPSTPEGEARQAEEAERIYTILFSHPAVEAITWWDFADRGAWQGAPAGLLGRDLKPKPAYQRLHQLIKEKWSTCTSGRTDAAGNARFRGFLGDYQVTVSVADKPVVSRQHTLSKDGENSITITVP